MLHLDDQLAPLRHTGETESQDVRRGKRNEARERIKDKGTVGVNKQRDFPKSL